MILKEYNLSVRLPQEKAIDTGITLVQNDKDVYKLNVRIFDGVNEIDYSEVDSATITFLKRDNNVVQGNMAVEADHLSYTLGTNEIACPGKVLVSIQLFGATERLSTARFVMSVERDLVTAEAVQSTSEFAILQQLKQDLEAIDVVELTNEFNAHKAESDVVFSDVVELTNEFNAHKAESVVYGQTITRDISIAGVQTIALPFKAKKITAFACIASTNNKSTGVYTDNNYQACNAYRGYNNDYIGNNSLIRLYSGSGNHITGTVQNVTDTGFEIFWAITGGSPTGTARVIIVAETHGEG